MLRWLGCSILNSGPYIYGEEKPVGKPKATETETLCFLSPFYSNFHSAPSLEEGPPVDIGISRQVLDRTKDKVTIVVPIKTLQGVENRESQFYGFSLLRSHVSLGILGAYQRQILFLPAYDQYLSLDTTF